MSRRAVLTDDQWERIAELLPSSEGCVGRPFRNHRQVVEGIVYRYRTGIAWRDLPEVAHRVILHGTGDRWVPARLSADFAVRARRAGARRCF